MIAALWLTAAMAGGDVCSDAKKAGAVAADLKALYDADLADHEANAKGLDKLDAKRAKQAEKLAPGACDAQSKFHAGWLMARSKDRAVIEEAHLLAKAAMQEHVQSANWLVGVTYDRWQVALGLPQRYASQTSVVDDVACLYPVLPESTDTERASYGLPKLTDAYRRVLDANGLTQEPATAEAMNRKHLFCESKPW